MEPHEVSVDIGNSQVNQDIGVVNSPLVTAVVTTYDRVNEAKRAIESVRAQTYAPLEIIVVEDGTDSGVEGWLRECEYGDIRYIKHTENQGLSAARNTAIALSSGSYIAFLDDDDVWKPQRIERQIQCLEDLSPAQRERLAVVYCAVEARENGRITSVIPPENEGNLRKAIERDGPSTLQSSYLFSKEALEAVGGFDENLDSSIDHDIWLSLAEHGYDAYTVPEALVISYDDFADSMMTNTDERISGVRQFVEKWRPTYYEWFGKDKGEKRIQRYFARIVGRLAAAKVVTGEFGDAWKAVSAIFTESTQTAYNVRILSILLAESALKRFFPPAVVRFLSQVRRQF
jgi:glycosyltransferase involved in cell wall biosynthesis